MTIVLLIKTISIALIEGLTEFIPVSSTGHMILLGNYIQFTGEKAATFEIFIQAGAILAALVIYRDRFAPFLPRRLKERSWIPDALWGHHSPNGIQIILAILPMVLVGAFAYETIKGVLFSPLTVAIGLIVGGVLMIIVELIPQTRNIQEIQDIGYKKAFLIGLGQCLSTWPGMSRSGSTMITGLLLGIRHKTIADFSFIIAVPLMIAAVGYDLLKTWDVLSIEDIPQFSIGFIVAFVVAWLSIRWFLSILSKIKLIPFGIYRIIIGIITLMLIH